MLLIVLEAAHILCLLLHSRGDGFNGDKDADFCVVLIHDVAEGTDLGDDGFAGFDFGEDTCVCLFHLLWLSAVSRRLSDFQLVAVVLWIWEFLFYVSKL